MEIFKLTWLVTEKFCQHFQFEWMAFENQESANLYGISFEYEENTNKKPSSNLTEDERVAGRLIGIENRGKCMEFLDASEVKIIESGNDKLYDVSFKLKYRCDISN